MKSAFSTMCPARPSTFSRSWPNRRLRYGWHNTEVRSEAGAVVRSEGRPLALPARGGEAGHRHHAARQAGWRPDRISVGRRLVRIPPRNGSAFPSPDREGAQEPARGPWRAAGTARIGDEPPPPNRLTRPRLSWPSRREFSQPNEP